jgi:hypothetical protein
MAQGFADRKELVCVSFILGGNLTSTLLTNVQTMGCDWAIVVYGGMYLCVCVCMYVCVCVCMYVYLYVCMYVCIYTCV